MADQIEISIAFEKTEHSKITMEFLVDKIQL